MMKFKTFTEELLNVMQINKLELWEKMEVNPETTYDTALPQEWLNRFVKDTRLNYDLVRSTTFYCYPKESTFGFPISGCTEVERYLALLLQRNVEVTEITIIDIFKELQHSQYKGLHDRDKLNHVINIAYQYINALEGELIKNKIPMPKLPIEVTFADPVALITKTLKDYKGE